MPVRPRATSAGGADVAAASQEVPLDLQALAIERLPLVELDVEAREGAVERVEAGAQLG